MLLIFVLVIRESILADWASQSERYVETSALRYIIKSIEEHHGVIISGPPGCGKSTVAHHAALHFKRKGYAVFPCENSKDILKFLRPQEKQLFVIDDFCGKFQLDMEKVDMWEQDDSHLSRIIAKTTLSESRIGLYPLIMSKPCASGYSNELEDSSISKKILHNEQVPDPKGKEDSKPKSGVNNYATCILTVRDNISNHKDFPKLTWIHYNHCKFSKEFRVTAEEMRSIALSYLPENTVGEIENLLLYDFFPLLCSIYENMETKSSTFFTHPVKIVETEVTRMKSKSQSLFVGLCFLVLSNNGIQTDVLHSENGCKIIKDICRACEIESYITPTAVEQSLRRMTGMYTHEINNCFKAIHDKMFDIISLVIVPLFSAFYIEYADLSHIAKRVQFQAFGKKLFTVCDTRL